MQNKFIWLGATLAIGACAAANAQDRAGPGGSTEWFDSPRASAPRPRVPQSGYSGGDVAPRYLTQPQQPYPATPAHGNRQDAPATQYAPPAYYAPPPQRSAAATDYAAAPQYRAAASQTYAAAQPMRPYEPMPQQYAPQQYVPQQYAPQRSQYAQQQPSAQVPSAAPTPLYEAPPADPAARPDMAPQAYPRQQEQVWPPQQANQQPVPPQQQAQQPLPPPQQQYIRTRPGNATAEPYTPPRNAQPVAERQAPAEATTRGAAQPWPGSAAQAEPVDAPVPVQPYRGRPVPTVTVPAPAAAASAPAPAAAQTWTIETADKTLYQSILRWTQKAGWQLVWEAERDFAIDAQVTLGGDFLTALQIAMKSLAGTDYPLQATANPETKVVRIARYMDGERR